MIRSCNRVNNGESSNGHVRRSGEGCNFGTINVRPLQPDVMLGAHVTALGVILISGGLPTLWHLPYNHITMAKIITYSISARIWRAKL